MKTKALNKTSVKTKTLATVIAVISAVALPQIAHVIGTYAGFGSSVGETFLPMHLPVILAGFAGGPVAGAVAGALSPVISFALTGMPSAVALPFIVIEVFTYGLVSGLLRQTSLNSFVKILAVQLSGRVMRIAAVAVATAVFGFEGMTVSAVLSSMALGVAGIIIQWVAVIWVSRKYEKSV